MKRTTRFKYAAAAGTVLALLFSASALAATIVGTSKNDVLRGTAKADTLIGKGGNDRLYGLGGNDTLIGGAGNDVLVGGPGADTLKCGPGHDIAVADANDTVPADCEIVRGPMLPSVSVGNVSVAEGNSGTTKLSFPVTLSGPVTWNVSVGFNTADGTATAPSDYTAANGTLTFAPGETTKTVDVSVNGDTTIEPDETLTVTLTSPANATLSGSTATGTIKNDDTPKPHGGHYTGLTSQNRVFEFDAASDATSITNLNFQVDVQCAEIDFRETNVPIDFGSAQIPLSPTFGFNVSGSDNNSDAAVSFSVTGSLSVGGSASGTARVDFAVHTPYGDVHCSTGDLTWSAQ
jgi:hypothetical protein